MGPSTTYAAGVWRALCTAAVAALALGCAQSPGGLEADDDQALAVFEAVEDEGYRSWPPPPTSDEQPRRRQASGAHGPWVEVYLHPDLLEAFFGDEPLEAWPSEVAAVVESYDTMDATTPYLRAAMRRDAQGWTWGQLDAASRPLTEARPDDCIGCHGAADDFVFSLFLPSA